VTSSFDFTNPDHIIAGCIGPPGARVFYLQARQESEVISLRLEKQQVAALCEYLGGILNDLALAVAYEEAEDQIVLVAEEFVTPPEGFDEDNTVAFDFDTDIDFSTARFRLTRAQVLAMITHANTVLNAGRPICQVCGRPMDPDGHFCPRNN